MYKDSPEIMTPLSPNVPVIFQLHSITSLVPSPLLAGYETTPLQLTFKANS